MLTLILGYVWWIVVIDAFFGQIAYRAMQRRIGLLESQIKEIEGAR